MNDKTQLIDQEVKFDENSEGLVIERYQAIPDQFIQNLRNERDMNRNSAAKDMHRVASIPVAVVEKWMREGKDFNNAKATEILGWLKAEGLDYFITSNKV